MTLSGRRVLAVSRKELLHILYDARTLFILFLMPVVQLVMFGYAMDMEIQRVDLAVIDLARSTASRHLIQHFEGSPFFRPFPFDGAPGDLDRLFRERRGKAALLVRRDFDRRLERHPETAVQVIVDASDANAATLIRTYCLTVLADFSARRGRDVPWPVEARPTFLFNPDLKSATFFVPGIVAMILVMISAMLTSITIAREKETGTMEQILVSPIRPAEIVAGKVLPYVGLAFLDAALILGLGMLIFKIPFRGSLLLLVALTGLYILAALSLGLLISTRARSQQVAMMAALTATLLPTIMLSGLVFPIASMPRLLQLLTYIVPARYYLLIVRGIMLKGSGLQHLVQPTLALGLLTLVWLAVSVRRLRMTLEG